LIVKVVISVSILLIGKEYSAEEKEA
jgi:hypothetical protein